MLKRSNQTLCRIGLLCAAAGTLLVSGGCSVKQGENANLIVGKQQFVAKCGSCHILARAGTKGTVGPSLDEAFHANVEVGGGRSTIRGIVEQQVAYPNSEGVMPAHLASGAVLKDIAAYVAQSAAAPGQDKGLLASAVEAPGSGKPVLEKQGKLQISADPTGQLSYVTKAASATAGKVTVEMPNMSGVSHNIAIETGEGGATPKGSKIGASAFTTKTTATDNVS